MTVPKVIYIETTNRCNAHCIMCPHDRMTRHLMDMPQDLFVNVIDNIKNYDLSSTQIFLHKEGEPLCDQNIIKRIEYACENLKSYGEIGISTNAMLLTKDKTEELLESGLNVIFFSVDGTSPETYEKIRVDCKYQTVIENVEYFLRKRKEKNKTKEIRVVMQMLLTGFNDHEKELFIKKWEGYSVEFYIKEMHCYLDGGKSSFLKPNFSKQISCCDDPFRLIVFYADGGVGACCWDYNNEYSIGKIEDGDLLYFYNNERMLYLRRCQQKLDCSNIAPCNRCGRIYGGDRISDY